MKKAFDQTVRDIKREVNKKVLKVPGIEQKVLDATSNEPWGPHGSHLADIAQATRNYNEYQLIMAVIWKRINDTGKNWRHVYKALTVLEYLVAHGSERVIDDIREHAYQISTLSDFQYIDSSGRDQGSNVRKKSQSLVVLVNDKERIQEVRQKALANRDKFRSPSAGGMYRPSSYTGGYGDRYDEDRYEGQYGEDRNGYGRDREWGAKDEDRYGRGGRYSRDSEDRYNRDGYRDEDYRGDRANDSYGPRSRDFDRERDRPYDDDDRYSSRSGGRVDDQSPDERRFERKLSQQSMGAPPSYEEVVNGVPGHNQNDIDGGATAPKISSPSANSPPAPKESSPSQSSPSAFSPPPVVPAGNTSSITKGGGAFDEFDPRASMSVPAPAPSNAEVDIFGLADVNPLALMPVTVATAPEAGVGASSDFGSNFVPLSSATTVLNQPAEDPFGDGPFRAFPSDDKFGGQNQSFATVEPATTASVASIPSQPVLAPNVGTLSNFEFADTFQGITYTSNVPNMQLPTTADQTLPPQQLPTSQSSNDLLGGILPQTGPVAAAAVTPVSSDGPASGNLGSITPFGVLAPPTVTHGSFGPSHFTPAAGHTGTMSPLGSSAPLPLGSTSPFGSVTPFGSHLAHQAPGTQLGPTGLVTSQAPDPSPPLGPSVPVPSSSLPASSALTQQPSTNQQSKDKFETKSTVWADTLSRGLVNLNISGPKINPLADIGIDFDSINRQEKRREKEKSATTVTSTITMGKAMGAGSGIGRAAASGLAPPPNAMMGAGVGMGAGMRGTPGMAMNAPGMGMGMGIGMGMGMGAGGYGGGMNQSMGMGMMNMGQGVQMRPPFPGVPGGYNPMMSMGGAYGSQQPYGGYRSG